MKVSKLNWFPSPLGVIFSLIKGVKKIDKIEDINKFPSPLGVIFSLIYLYQHIDRYNNSFCFRLLSELYSLLYYTQKIFCL